MARWMKEYYTLVEVLAQIRIESSSCSYLSPPQIFNHSPIFSTPNSMPSPLHGSAKTPPLPHNPTSADSIQNTMPTPSARPAILDSNILRIICPLKRPSRPLTTATHQLPRNQPWSHPPASISIDNDQVARLASQPLHSLTLADLVR